MVEESKCLTCIARGIDFGFRRAVAEGAIERENWNVAREWVESVKETINKLKENQCLDKEGEEYLESWMERLSHALNEKNKEKALEAIKNLDFSHAMLQYAYTVCEEELIEVCRRRKY